MDRAQYGLGNRAEAQQHLLDALEIAVEIHALIPLLHLMPIIPLFFADTEEPSLKERTIELYTLACTRTCADPCRSASGFNTSSLGCLLTLCQALSVVRTVRKRSTWVDQRGDGAWATKGTMKALRVVCGRRLGYTGE
jgi:hypothetical protein